MDIKTVLGIGGAAAAVFAVTLGCSKASAQRNAPATERTVELTVYKEDFAMVSERRPVNLTTGHLRLAVDDISKELDPDSVLFDWQDAKHHPDVVATTYNLGVGNGSTLLSRLNGQQVDMIWPSNDGKPGETISGRLEAAQQGEGFALRTKDKLYVNPGGTIVASAGAASTLPQLAVELDSDTAGKSELDMSYLTRGMSWSADYVAKLDSDADQANLECWATVTNKTGVAFPEAKLTLMAGSPNRSVRPRAEMAMTPMAEAKSMARDSAGGELGQRGFRSDYAAVGELYAYKIPSVATIGQDQMNRVSLLGTKTVPIKRDYAIRVPALSIWGYDFDGRQSVPHTTATLSIAFVNDEASNLGLPLPAGSISVYEKDKEGQTRLTGAASIGDTAKNEHVNLTLTNVFDVYAEYRVLKTAHVGKHTVRKTVEVVLHNEKRLPVDVRLVQSYYAQWTPVVESDKSEKLDSSTVQWKLRLEAGDQRKLTYTVDMKG